MKTEPRSDGEGSGPLADALGPLRQHEGRLAAEVEAMQAELAGKKGELVQVRRAIGALTDTNKSASRKPAAPVEVVTAVVQELLSTRGSIRDADLLEFVAAEVSKQGYSRIGLQLRLNAVLRKDSRFLDSQDTWKLEEPTDA